jgi:hypothetical protein
VPPAWFDRLIVTTVATALALAAQLAKPANRLIVGFSGTLNKVSKVTLIVLPATSAPEAVVVKPTVQVETAFALCGEPVKVTDVTLVAAAIVIEAAGLPTAVSSFVATLKVVLISEAAAGFVSPAIESVAAVELASAQVPALLARVIVTVFEIAEALAAQLAKPVTSVTVGLVGTAKPLLKTAVMVSPALRAPVLEVVKPTVQVEVAPAVCGEPVKVTEAGLLAAAMTIEALGLAVAVSGVVVTEKFGAV